MARLRPSTDSGSHRPRVGALWLVLGMLTAHLLGCQPSPESRLDEIRILQDAGDHGAASELLRGLLDESPDHAEANYRLGLALARTGRPSSAVWPLTKAAEDDELGTSASLLLATILIETQNREEAREWAGRVIAKEPENLGALELRSRANSLLNDLEPALEDVDRILDIDAEHETAQSLRATLLLQLERVEEAKEALLVFLETTERMESSNAARACIALASFYSTHEGYEDDGLALLERCRDDYGSDPLVIRFGLQMYDLLDRRDEGNAMLEQLLEEEPENLQHLSLLARRKFEAGDVEGAAQLADRMVEQAITAAEWSATGSVLHGLGQQERAAEAAARSLELDPSNDSTRVSLAELYIGLGRIDRAEALVADFQEPVFRSLVSGQLQIARGEYEPALENLEIALQDWPNNAEARVLAAETATRLGRMSVALSHLLEATRLQHGRGPSAVLLARSHLNQGNYKLAASFAEGYLTRNRSTDPLGGAEPTPLSEIGPEAYVIAARAYAEMELFKRARDRLDELRKRSQYRALAITEIAALLQRTAGDETAIEFLRDLDLANPANEVPLRKLVQLLADAGRGEEASKLLAELRVAAPDDGRLAGTHGLLLLHLGDRDSAVAALKRAGELDPDDPSTLAGRGLLAQSEGKLDEATALLERAAEGAPNEASYRYEFARLLSLTGQREEAERVLRELVLSHPEHLGGANDLAWMLAEQDEDLEFASELAQRAVRIAPEPQVRDTLGYVQLRSGAHGAAIETFEGILRDEPDFATTRFHLALALEADGNVAGAREALEMALASSPFPEVEEARKTLARLDEGQR